MDFIANGYFLRIVLTLISMFVIGYINPAMAMDLPRFDFKLASSVKDWSPAHDVSRILPSQEGMQIEISGSDPYIVGPARDYPAGQLLWLRIRLKSDQGGLGQIFYFTTAPSEKDSIRFQCKAGVWEEIRIPLPALGSGFHLRFDPPGDSGHCTVSSIAFEPRILINEPVWPVPDFPNPLPGSLVIQSGDLKIISPSPQWNDFIVEVAGEQMALGNMRPLIGIMTPPAPNSELKGRVKPVGPNGREAVRPVWEGRELSPNNGDNGPPAPNNEGVNSPPLLGAGRVRWLDLGQQAWKGSGHKNGNTISNSVSVAEEDGTTWQISQTFSPTAIPGAFDVETKVSTSKDRTVVYLPMLTMHPGAGSFGESKDHALFAGLEYLDKNEPSSSKADIEGPESNRLVPDSLKVTIPLMAVQAKGRYVGLSWTPDPSFCAMFDSPDRHFHSGGHAMGILFPGSDMSNREAGSLIPYDGVLLKADKPLIFHATILGGKGESMVPLLQQYVALRGLPNIPRTGMNAQGYYSLAAAGWLDSGIAGPPTPNNGGANSPPTRTGASTPVRVRGARENGLKFRHALPGNFQYQAAADAALLMDWLALKTDKPKLSSRLQQAAKDALAVVPPDELNFGGVSHVRYPVEALVYGHIEENAVRAARQARELLARFTPDGTISYRKSPAGLDYGRTHFAQDANGLTAQLVSTVLDSAAVSGDSELIKEGIGVLRALDKFANSAPRGAQTWEVPLHTPDILASAYLVRAYTMGYALTGEAHFLEMARYWAWTGVPFIYLNAPASNNEGRGKREEGRDNSLFLNNGGDNLPPRTGALTPVRAGGLADPVGAYATIPVFGATQWVAPNWMGLPVQWCGLVYSDALYRLLKYDPNPLWKQLADGITASGIQQTWPIKGNPLRQGLLPDSFNLRPQSRNDAAINPGTLQANAVSMITGNMLYEMQVFRADDLHILHAPGAIRNVNERPGKMSFTVQGWPNRPYYLLLTGFKSAPGVLINGIKTSLIEPNSYNAATGRLILQVSGTPQIEISF